MFGFGLRRVVADQALKRHDMPPMKGEAEANRANTPRPSRTESLGRVSETSDEIR